MEEALKIQEEFENLIEQLERLRSINDITSANADSTEKVITEVESFIHGIQSYKESIETDLIAKSEMIDTLLVKLNKTAQELDSKTNNLAASVNHSFLDFKNSSSSEIEVRFSELSSSVQLTIKKIEKLKTDVSNLLNSQRTQILEGLDANRHDTLNEINNLKNQFSSSSNIITKAINNLNAQVLEKHNKLNQAISTNKYLLICNIILLLIFIIVFFKKF